jgi:hypothetical protein
MCPPLASHFAPIILIINWFLVIIQKAVDFEKDLTIFGIYIQVLTRYRVNWVDDTLILKEHMKNISSDRLQPFCVKLKKQSAPVRELFPIENDTLYKLMEIVEFKEEVTCFRVHKNCTIPLKKRLP